MAAMSRTQKKMHISSPEQALLKNLLRYEGLAQPYPRTRCVHQLFEEQVQRSPEALAVSFEGTHLSYRDLNEQANQLAHRLRALGVGAESLVGVCLQRSPDLVISLLAILKAGGAYVPLDPSYPAQRLTFMVADAHLSLLITQQALIDQLPTTSVQMFCLEQERARLAAYPHANLNMPMFAEELAYVIYTSGSTGTPKGVQISHTSLLNLVHWHLRSYTITADDRATQLASIAFDACVWEIWPYLLAGACLFFPGEEVRLSPLLLRDWLIAQRITYCFLPTPLAEGMLTMPWPDQVPLRALLTGGDKLRHYPDASLPFRLINHYGPTESTVVATAGSVPSAREAYLSDPDIGRPIDNTWIYVLDAHLQVVPQGDIGELYIGGASLARGYLRRPELTAERFIPDPFSRQPGERLYRTGDLVRLQDDGTLQYIGRSDQQVKIRGFRIELEEIEIVLRQHPAVKECIVLVREDVPEQKELVAYLIPSPDYAQGLAIKELQRWMQDRLPDYMVPSAFVLLETFPLTTNGKVDQRALPAPQKSRDLLENTYVAPRTELEALLANIWAEVLALPQVGVEDNFFALGGHSLRATQVLARIASMLQIDVPIRSFFDKPTIRGIVEYIESHDSNQRASEVPALYAVGREQEIPLSAAQQRLWFLDRLDPGKATYNYSIAWRLRGALDLRVLHEALCAIGQRHEALRTSFVVVQEQPVQRIAASATLGWQVDD
ncbi:MAG TPA: amino acid adenylation domain-containing protein, partial [Ktedonobacteraceae bacterium]|nr:amino acid adenylation domain-containing protein [Ktedonobacteraceae bacterium]